MDDGKLGYSRNVCLEDFIGGPVRGKTPWRGTGSFPLTPLKYFIKAYISELTRLCIANTDNKGRFYGWWGVFLSGGLGFVAGRGG